MARNQARWIGVLAAIALAAAAGHAEAQIPRYESPSGPTLSPYLNYFRNDYGALNPYYNFIRPQRNLESALYNLNMAERANQAQLRRLQQGLLAPSDAAATGIRVTYMNYSHYYPGLQQPSAPRRSPAQFGRRR